MQYHVHMVTAKIPLHVSSHKILSWLINHVGACQYRGVFHCEGLGWHWRFMHAVTLHDGTRWDGAHVITFAPDVGSDIITQFTLTWT